MATAKECPLIPPADFSPIPDVVAQIESHVFDPDEIGEIEVEV